MPRRLIIKILAFIVCIALAITGIDFAFGLDLILNLRQVIEHEFGYRPVAVYGNSEFVGYRAFDALWYDHKFAGDDKIFVASNDGNAVPVSKITQSFLAINLTKDSETTKHGDQTYYSIGSTSILFVRDKLIMVNIEGTSHGFKIGPTKDGPFISLPIDRETMYKLWGRPDRWERDYIEGI